MLFYVLSNFTNAEIESLVEKLQAEQEKFMSVNKLYIAVSKTDCNIKSLSKHIRLCLRCSNFLNAEISVRCFMKNLKSKNSFLP